MINIVIFGPPGSGKGTQSKKIIEKYGYTHISTGELLRQEIASGSELGHQVEAIISKGELVSDELIIDILSNELDRLGNVPGIIFDGFPRTLNQASELKNMLSDRGTAISALLFLDVPHEVLIERLLKRKSIDGRADDTMEVIENRLRVYQQQTAPVVEFYRKQGKLRTIDGTGSVDEIFNRIDKVLQELQ
ncbi:MAG: adenylate kinase [Chlorobi bacterium]|nr:adenylate kinase [Chlorobiota bacterium]